MKRGDVVQWRDKDETRGVLDVVCMAMGRLWWWVEWEPGPTGQPDRKTTYRGLSHEDHLRLKVAA